MPCSLLAIAMLFATLFAGSVSCASANGIESPAWLLKYQSKSTNEFIWDQRARSLVNTRVPAMLSDALMSALGGPPDPVFVVSDRYVSVSACRAHSCTEKGFLWIDTQTGAGLGAHHVPDTLLLGSNGLSANKIPHPAKAALIAWLTEHDLQTKSVEFFDHSGKPIALNADEYKGREKYHAPSTGPAFDCKLAASEIEKAVCANIELSAQDLALDKLYNTIRQGSSTTIAREQLRYLQRKWLTDRDAECAPVIGMDTCLKESYSAQYDRLMHWVPKNPRTL